MNITGVDDAIENKFAQIGITSAAVLSGRRAQPKNKPG
jgi:hypothetical protein